MWSSQIVIKKSADGLLQRRHIAHISCILHFCIANVIDDLCSVLQKWHSCHNLPYIAYLSSSATDCFQPPPLRSYRPLTCFIKAALLQQLSCRVLETSCDYMASFMPMSVSFCSQFDRLKWWKNISLLHGIIFPIRSRDVSWITWFLYMLHQGFCSFCLGAVSPKLFYRQSLKVIVPFNHKHILRERQSPHMRRVSRCFALHIFPFYCCIML